MAKAQVVKWPDVSGALKSIANEAYEPLRTKVLPRQVLAFDDERFDPDDLRSKADKSRINCLAFWRSSVLPVSTGGTGERTAPRPTVGLERQRTAGRMLVQEYTVQLRVYLQYRTGDEVSNSQIDFDLLIDTFTEALAARPSLGFETELFGSASDLIWTELSIHTIGGDTGSIHYGAGNYAVRVRIPLDVNPE